MPSSRRLGFSVSPLWLCARFDQSCQLEVPACGTRFTTKTNAFDYR